MNAHRLPSPPAAAGGTHPPFFVRVQRSARPPLPWTWAIYRQGDLSPCRSAVRGYGTADEAWEAGRAALARLSAQTDPA